MKSRLKEGYAAFGKYRTYYKIYGDPQANTPLVVLHGGPGYPHYYLENLSALAEKGIPVVFYDQLGCGQSDRPKNNKLWKTKTFTDELANLRESLGLKDIYLLGHSWGTMLAVDYMNTKPRGVKKLILASPVVDSQLWAKEADKLKASLGKTKADIMNKHEKNGTTSDSEYKKVYAEYVECFVCRVKPRPEAVKKSDSQNGGPVYRAMWGPSETTVSGNLKNWTMLGRLGIIKVPTLFTSGKYDEATPYQTRLAHKELADSKWVLFNKSSHMAHLEEPKKYLNTIGDFLAT